MYELLDGVLELPIREDEFISVRQGMNKINISVGEHVSEPSQVFLVTGRSQAGYLTFAVFYMLEPQTRVIYSYDANPYDHSLIEQVEQEGTEFLEEMGAIVEVVDWAGMSEGARGDWLSQTSLLAPADDVEVLDADALIEEVEEVIEIEDEVVTGDTEDLDAGEAHPEEEELIAEEAEDEPEAGDADATGEDIREAEEGSAPEAEADADREAAGREIPEEPEEEDEEPDEKDEDEDDEEEEGETDPLKEAFLKPDWKRKTSTLPRVKRVKPSEVEDELQRAREEASAGEEGLETQGEPPLDEMDDDLFAEEELNRAEEEILSAADTGPGPLPAPPSGRETTDGTWEADRHGSTGEVDDETAVEILRFLSKI